MDKKVPSDVRGEVARKLQEANRHLEMSTARYYVDAVCDLLAKYGQPAQPAGPDRHPDVHDNNSVLVGFADDAQPAARAELPVTEQEEQAWQRMERRS